jgi:hypothetical protein
VAGRTAASPTAPTAAPGALAPTTRPARTVAPRQGDGGYGHRAVQVAAAVGRTLAPPLVLLGGLLLYLGLQRLIDRGPKLRWAGRGAPEDEVIEL